MPRFREVLSRLAGRAPLPVPMPADTKASRTGPLLSIETLGPPVWTPRDYASFAREGYAQNAIVHRCVRMIAEAAASVPLLLYEGDAEVADNPLIDVMRRPCPGMTGTDLLESWYGYLLVAGNAYMEAVALDGDIRELHALRPDRMKVVPGPDGWPEAWEYEVAGRSVRFTGEVADGIRPILHLKLFNPGNDHYGLSPIEAAAVAIDIHNEASRWNKALLDNSARPSGALVYAAANGQMTGDQFERLKRELETTYQGARHAGRPLLLEGGLDWKPLSLSPKDMDFIEAKNAAAREIALAIGVPPMLLGIPGDNTYSNYQEASRAFWRQTVLPLVARTARALSGWLGGGTLEWRADLDQVEALSPEREALWTRLDKATFLTQAEKRAAAGYEGEQGGGPGIKYSPEQLRVPRGKPAGGQWTGQNGGEEGDGGDDSEDLGAPFGTAPDGTPVEAVSRRRGRPTGAPGQEARLDIATARARSAEQQIRELDPTWQRPQSLTSRDSIEGAIRHQEAIAQSAEARLAEKVRDAIPNTNPSWGASRLRKELSTQGFLLEKPTDSPGLMFTNPSTGERVRIMEQPGRAFRNDPPEKHHFQFYYRYQRPNQPWGTHVPIPDKE